MSIQSDQPSTDPSSASGLDPAQDTVEWVLRIPPTEVVYVTAILEGYEGLCLTTSLDREASSLIVQVPSGQVDLLREVLDSIELAVGSIEELPRSRRTEAH